jgi:hypothetical protein
MRVFKTMWFQKWAVREGMGNEVLLAAAEEMNGCLIDAELGGLVIKKRGRCRVAASEVVPAPWWSTGMPVWHSLSMDLQRTNGRTSATMS